MIMYNNVIMGTCNLINHIILVEKVILKNPTVN